MRLNSCFLYRFQHVLNQRGQMYMSRFGKRTFCAEKSSFLFPWHSVRLWDFSASPYFPCWPLKFVTRVYLLHLLCNIMSNTYLTIPQSLLPNKSLLIWSVSDNFAELEAIVDTEQRRVRNVATPYVRVQPNFHLTP